MLRKRAFTLVELLIIMAILGILAAIVVPRFTNATDVGRTAAMASNTRLVRGFIAIYSTQPGVVLSAEGFPEEVSATWFPKNALPSHAWTGSQLIIEVVSGNTNAVYPASKTFDTTNAAAANAWYNTSNGAFCVRVPAQTTDAATLEMFNDANSSSVATINQTTR